jgi:hypothetical protein
MLYVCRLYEYSIHNNMLYVCRLYEYCKHYVLLLDAEVKRVVVASHLYKGFRVYCLAFSV